MNCAEFQAVLPYIIETGGNAEEEKHLHECPVCSDLVKDLRYIAEQAKLLVPMEDPSPQVWVGIRASLEREGLVKKPGHSRGRLLGFSPWLAAAGAAMLVIIGIALYQRANESQPAPAIAADSSASDEDQQDQQLLAQLAVARPEIKDAYEHSLKQVNSSIRETRQALAGNPSDEDARAGLLRAYEQKAMVYDMATRSLQ